MSVGGVQAEQPSEAEMETALNVELRAREEAVQENVWWLEVRALSFGCTTAGHCQCSADCRRDGSEACRACLPVAARTYSAMATVE